jgi:hypothetical protein
VGKLHEGIGNVDVGNTNFHGVSHRILAHLVAIGQFGGVEQVITVFIHHPHISFKPGLIQVQIPKKDFPDEGGLAGSG